MYYRESDTIAHKYPDLADAIVALDDHLFANQGGHIRIEGTADIIGVDPDILRNLLEVYVENKVIHSTNVPLCPKCDIPIEETGDNVTCDLCERRFPISSLKLEMVYHPRETLFECGDTFSRTIKTSFDVDGLYQIAGCKNDERIADIVFMHGLGGDAKQTWHPSNEPESFFPKWLGEALPDVGVWSLEYDAAQSKWTGDALSLPDRATDVLGRLDLAGFGGRPIIFVTHSLGGLVAKQVLRHAKEMAVNDWKTIGESISGIMFIATPHSGSDLSSYLKYVSAFARTTAAITDLESHHPRLRELNVWFRNNCAKHGISVGVLYETKATSTSFGFSAVVVDPTSSDPGIAGIAPIPIETDHISICKPSSKTAPVFQHTVKFIKRCLASKSSS